MGKEKQLAGKAGKRKKKSDAKEYDIILQKKHTPLTPWPPRGGKTPGLGTGPVRGLLAGGGPRVPLVEAQV